MNMTKPSMSKYVGPVALVATLFVPELAFAQQGGGGGAPPAGGGGGGFVVTDEEDSQGVYGLDENQEPVEEGKPGQPSRGPVPETHTIKKGDTLWDICKNVLGSPWEWPKVWSYNPNITNPHWIFPGDTIRLVPGSIDEPAEEASVAAPATR